MEDLKKMGRLAKKGIFKHNYPYCWRSDKPLIYKAVSTWFINVSSMRKELV
jgi:isoleucyl-tRNA synthetase